MIFEEATIWAKGVKALVALTYFPTHLKAKLCPSRCEGGTPEEESEGSKGTKGPWSKGIVAANVGL